MSFVYAFLGFCALIVLHEAGHFAAAKAVGMRVERFSLFMPPRLFGIKRGETDYCVGALPLGGYVKITGMNPSEVIPEEVAHRAYYKQAVWKRVVVILAGPVVNVVVAFALLWFFYVAQGEPQPLQTTTTVDQITKDSAAAGILRPGDKIVAVDGVRGDSARLRQEIGTHRCAGAQTDGCRAATPARLSIVRDGRQQVVSVRPIVTTTDGETRPLVGFAFGALPPTYVKQGPIEASGTSVATMWRVTHLTVEAIGRLFYSSEARKQVSGVVGSYETTRQTIKSSSFENVMSILALISLSLAIINLFPFLPLDGGHIFWALAEKVRGRAISFTAMERASVVGFVLIAALFVVGLTNDIGRLQGAGFGVR